MTREAQIKDLKDVEAFLSAMSDRERYNFLYKNSDSFKSDMDRLDDENQLTITHYDIGISVSEYSDMTDGETFVSVNQKVELWQIAA